VGIAHIYDREIPRNESLALPLASPSSGVTTSGIANSHSVTGSVHKAQAMHGCC